MIQSYLEHKYLQLYEDVEDAEKTQFNQKISHIDDVFLDLDKQKDTQLKIINHTFSGQLKQKMLFFLEEIPEGEAKYAYQGNCIYDELLEFYAFLNVWAVKEVEFDDTSERYYFDHDSAIDSSDDLFDKVQKVLFILGNIEEMLESASVNGEELKKCKDEIVEQGILDIIMRILEIIYYKTTPPPMFQRPFISNKLTKSQDADIFGSDGRKDPTKVKIDEYVGQEIAREHLDIVLMRMLDIVLTLIRSHRTNSEMLTKYFGILYQHLVVQEHYMEIARINPQFEAENAPIYMSLIGEIFKRAHKNAIMIFNDRSANALIEYNKKAIKKQLNKGVQIHMRKYDPNRPKEQPLMIGIDSKLAQENIERSSQTNQVQKWLDLLEPVKFIDEHN